MDLAPLLASYTYGRPPWQRARKALEQALADQAATVVEQLDGSMPAASGPGEQAAARLSAAAEQLSADDNVAQMAFLEVASMETGGRSHSAAQPDQGAAQQAGQRERAVPQQAADAAKAEGGKAAVEQLSSSILAGEAGGLLQLSVAECAQACMIRKARPARSADRPLLHSSPISALCTVFGRITLEGSILNGLPVCLQPSQVAWRAALPPLCWWPPWLGWWCTAAAAALAMQACRPVLCTLRMLRSTPSSRARLPATACHPSSLASVSDLTSLRWWSRRVGAADTQSFVGMCQGWVCVARHS